MLWGCTSVPVTELEMLKFIAGIVILGSLFSSGCIGTFWIGVTFIVGIETFIKLDTEGCGVDGICVMVELTVFIIFWRLSAVLVLDIVESKGLDAKGFGIVGTLIVGVEVYRFDGIPIDGPGF